MDEQRRYGEEPDHPRYPGSSSHDPGPYQRPDGAYRLPVEPGAPAYPGRDGSAAGFPVGAVPEPAADAPTTPRSALDAIRLPLRPPDHPAGRSTPAAEAGRPRPDRWSDVVRPDQMPTTPIRADAGRPEPLRSEPLRSEPPRVGSRRGGDTVYRTRRPVSAAVFTVVTALLLVPVVRLLVDAGFAAEPGARGIVPAVLMALGLPLTGVGLYGVAGAGGVVDRQVFLRPPAGYLPVGLVLLVAAGLAVA